MLHETLDYDEKWETVRDGITLTFQLMRGDSAAKGKKLTTKLYSEIHKYVLNGGGSFFGIFF